MAKPSANMNGAGSLDRGRAVEGLRSVGECGRRQEVRWYTLLIRSRQNVLSGMSSLSIRLLILVLMWLFHKVTIYGRRPLTRAGPSSHAATEPRSRRVSALRASVPDTRGVVTILSPRTDIGHAAPIPDRIRL